MGLKDLKSNLDLVQGATNPTGEMETTVPTGFDNGPTSTLHTDSLANLPTKSPFQDLNGVPDPNYNRIQDSSSPFNTEDHLVDLLENKNVSSNNTNTVYQAGQNTPPNDLDGLDGPSFENGPSSTLHVDSLAQQYQYQHGNSTTVVGPVPSAGNNSNIPQSLDGIKGPDFEGNHGQAQGLHTDSLINEYQYRHGDSNATVGPSALDGDGLPIGMYNYNTDPDSPFLTPTMGGDHMITLLTSKVQSQNTNLTYAAAGHNGVPQDLDGAEYGNGLFHENSQGKQIGGQDLHVHLLTNGYSYTHGRGGHASVLAEGERGHAGGRFDLDGGFPSTGAYIDNLPE
tara:strand:+ start:3763 stop:4782 length:1020 start_codon:yes stop_codon:yes gene_type:complete